MTCQMLLAQNTFHCTMLVARILYRVKHVFVEELSLNYYDMFHQRVGWYCSCPAAQLINESS